MNYIVFYNYLGGTRDFGYYEDYDEAHDRYINAIEEAKKYKSSIEVGFAEIVESSMVIKGVEK